MNAPATTQALTAIEAAAALQAQQRARELISRVEDVPAGALLSVRDGKLEISDERRLDVVVIAQSQGHALGLFSQEAFGTALMFDVVRRARFQDIEIQPRLTTREVIRLVYEAAEDVSSVEASDQTNVEMQIRALIEAAVAVEASDVHIETRDGRADVLLRINGERVFKENLSFETARSIGSVMYSVLADAQSKLPAWDMYRLSEGTIDYVTKAGQKLRLRFSSSPIHPTGNFHIVIRMEVMSTSRIQLDGLGYSPAQLRTLDTFTLGSGGMVLMVGPTNSGKSKSMQCLLMRLFQVRGTRLKVITVEDPVEFEIPGACQISVPQRRAEDGGRDSAFAALLRGVLRQDPDVVEVGEVRDAESTAILAELGLAGRKVFTSVHANSAIAAFMRLRKLGVEADLLTMKGFIAGACYQKLVPVLCPDCSEDDDIDRSESLLHETVAALRWQGRAKKRGPGCMTCKGTAIVGRTRVAEILVPEPELLASLAAGDQAGAEALWLKGCGNPSFAEGIPTAHDHLVQKILAGQVSIKDGYDYMGTATAYHFREVVDA